MYRSHLKAGAWGRGSRRSHISRWADGTKTFLESYTPTLNIVGLPLGPLLQDWPMWLASLVTLPITMLVVSYVILPWLTHFFRRWLAGR